MFFLKSNSKLDIHKVIFVFFLIYLSIDFSYAQRGIKPKLGGGLEKSVIREQRRIKKTVTIDDLELDKGRLIDRVFAESNLLSETSRFMDRFNEPKVDLEKAGLMKVNSLVGDPTINNFIITNELKARDLAKFCLRNEHCLNCMLSRNPRACHLRRNIRNEVEIDFFMRAQRGNALMTAVLISIWQSENPRYLSNLPKGFRITPEKIARQNRESARKQSYVLGAVILYVMLFLLVKKFIKKL